ncbi:MAG: zinc ribbon domain-containing protein [Actinomycetota bacterium]
MLADERRCPACNALAAPDADWCGQCFTSLRLPDPEPPTGLPLPAAPDGEPRPRATAEGDGSPAVATWPCPACDGRNPMSADVCASCGTPFATLMRTGGRPVVDARDAVTWSLIFPGLGHRLAGRPMDGLARGSLFAISLGMAVLLMFTGEAALTTIAVLVLFLGAAVAVYVVSAVEAARVARGGDLLVGSRLLMWILVGMTFVSVGALALAVASATPG